MVLSKGRIKKEIKDTVVYENYEARLVSYEALPEMVDLIQRVYDQLPNKEVLFVDSYDDMKEDLDKGAKVMAIYAGDKTMVAYRYVSFPGLEERNLGYDLGLGVESLKKMCQLETTVVDPPYRGNNLQYMTLSLMKPIVEAEGYTHLACTISPYNYFSVNNIMRHSLKIKDLKRKYGTLPDGSDGIWRYILHGTMEENSKMVEKHMINVPMANIPEQKELLEKGYIGHKLNRDQTIDYVHFTPPY